MARFLGFEITKAKKKDVRSFAAPENDDGALPIASGGAFGQYIDMAGSIKNEIELINRYRDMALHPECDAAIDDVVNEAIVIPEDEDNVVKLDLENLGAPDTVKKKIHESFDSIIDKLNFNEKAYEIFRKWYVDGRLYYHIIIDEKNKKQGIQELRYIDPRKIRKVRENVKSKAQNGIDMIQKSVEYFVFNEKAIKPDAQISEAVRILPDAIAHVTSGMFDHSKNVVVSHLHKAIKPLNQLRMMEDALVIYRISRAPERRLFYIDVGNLPKAKAEQYLQDTMNRYRNKLVYDADTGEIKDDRKHMAMLEDFWLPRREGGRGTEISTLPGGQNLGEMEDVIYFLQKFYKSLNVPSSRIDDQNGSGFSLGRESEITRDELKFSKFVQRLRTEFTDFFNQLLKAQLIFQGIIKAQDWDKIKHEIAFVYAEDNFYREQKNSEILNMRLEALSTISEFAGRYFSMAWIKKNIMQMTDKEIKKMQKEIDAEVDGGKIVKDATIEWGAMGPQGPPEPEVPEVPPEQPPPSAPAPVPPTNGQPPAQEEQQVLQELSLDIDAIRSQLEDV
ncbi:portal protein [archaeon]|nr:portal protein [archaeon]